MVEKRKTESTVSDQKDSSLIPPKDVAPTEPVGATGILNLQTSTKSPFDSRVSTDSIQTDTIPVQNIAGGEDSKSSSQKNTGEYSDAFIEADNKISSLSAEKQLVIRLLDRTGFYRHQLIFNDDLLNKAEQALKLIPKQFKGSILAIDEEDESEFLKNLHKILLEDSKFVQNYIAVRLFKNLRIASFGVDRSDNEINIRRFRRELFYVFKRFENLSSSLQNYSYELFLSLKDFHAFKSNYGELSDPYVLEDIIHATLLTSLQEKGQDKLLLKFVNRILEYLKDSEHLKDFYNSIFSDKRYSLDTDTARKFWKSVFYTTSLFAVNPQALSEDLKDLKIFLNSPPIANRYFDYFLGAPGGDRENTLFESLLSQINYNSVEKPLDILLFSSYFSNLLKDDNLAFINLVSRAQYYLDKFRDYLPSKEQIKSVLTYPLDVVKRSVESERERKIQEEKEKKIQEEKEKKIQEEEKARLEKERREKEIEQQTYLKPDFISTKKILVKFDDVSDRKFWLDKIKKQFAENSLDVSFLATTRLLGKVFNKNNPIDEDFALKHPLLFLHLQSYFYSKYNYFTTIPDFGQINNLRGIARFNETMASKLIESFDSRDFAKFLKENSPTYFSSIIFNDLISKLNKRIIIDESSVNESATNLNTLLNESTDNTVLINLLVDSEKLYNIRIDLSDSRLVNSLAEYIKANEQKYWSNSSLLPLNSFSHKNINDLYLHEFYKLCDRNEYLTSRLLISSILDKDEFSLEYEDGDKFYDYLLSLPFSSLKKIVDDAKKLLFVAKIFSALNGNVEFFGKKTVEISTNFQKISEQDKFNLSYESYNYNRFIDSFGLIDYLIDKCESANEIHKCIREYVSYKIGSVSFWGLFEDYTLGEEFRQRVENSIMSYIRNEFNIDAKKLYQTNVGVRNLFNELIYRVGNSVLIPEYLEDDPKAKSREAVLKRFQDLLDLTRKYRNYDVMTFIRLFTEKFYEKFTNFSKNYLLPRDNIYGLTLNNYYHVISNNYRELKDYLVGIRPIVLAYLAYRTDADKVLDTLLSYAEYVLNSENIEEYIYERSFRKSSEIGIFLELLDKVGGQKLYGANAEDFGLSLCLKICALQDLYLGSTYFICKLKEKPIRIDIPKTIAFKSAGPLSEKINYMIEKFSPDDWLSFVYVVNDVIYNETGEIPDITSEISIEKVFDELSKYRHKKSAFGTSLEDYAIDMAIRLHRMRNFTVKYARRSIKSVEFIRQVLNERSKRGSR